MAKKATESGSSTLQERAYNEPLREKLDNKTEAVRRALDELGWDAKSAVIVEHVKKYYGVDVSPKVVSVYKGKLTKAGHRPRRRGRRPKAEAVAAATPAAAVPAAPRAGGREAAIDIGDLRSLKELSERIGLGRLRDLVELLAP
jgi:hypothetical protein